MAQSFKSFVKQRLMDFLRGYKVIDFIDSDWKQME